MKIKMTIDGRIFDVPEPRALKLVKNGSAVLLTEYAQEPEQDDNEDQPEDD